MTSHIDRLLARRALVPLALVLMGAAESAPARAADAPSSAASPWVVDYRYAPPWWQTSICLPDDWQKTLVGREGMLLYDFGGGKYHGFKSQISFGLAEKTQWNRQALLSPRVPIVRTWQKCSGVEVSQEAFAAAPGSATAAPQVPGQDAAKPPRRDVLLVRLHNAGAEPASVTPRVTVESQHALSAEPEKRQVAVGKDMVLSLTEAFKIKETSDGRLVLESAPIRLEAGAERTLACEVAVGPGPKTALKDAAEAESLRTAAETYWKGASLPYDRLQVPDAGVQALLDGSIRNIYQAREIKKGLPAFQVGPTCYRGLWVVDGSFLMEAVTFLGRADESRSGIRYLLGFQRDDGAFMLINGHWKETGIVLWAVTRHARLTDDKAWLREVWPNVERGFAYIQKMRQTAADDPKAPNYRLIPAGFSDGGLAGQVPEYTNVYWSLAGMNAAVEAARWLGNAEQANRWQREYDDFCAVFRRAAERDLRTDEHGNRYLPIRMVDTEKVAPQKAQWAFLHAVFPGKVFALDDPLVRGNMAMLRGVESERLVFGTGWLSDGIWNYFGSFYGHAWLWLGDGPKAAETLYAFANHASPLLVWREEQMPVGKGDGMCGDMPHNWASAEFIRLVRHLLVVERGQELHLLEGLPPTWAGPGAVTRVREVLTEFGPISLELRVAQDGSKATLRLEPPRRNPPKRIVLHLGGWAGPSDPKAMIELPTDAHSERTIRIDRVTNHKS